MDMLTGVYMSSVASVMLMCCRARITNVAKQNRMAVAIRLTMALHIYCHNARYCHSSYVLCA